MSSSHSAPTTNTAGNPFLARVYACRTPADIRALYDEWASTFDADLQGPAQDYVAPALVAQAVLSVGGRLDGEVFDAGCGTGLSGVALAQAGAARMDGVDISPGMLEVARRTGVYRALETADLSQEIEGRWGEGRYDVVACVGTLTHGHVGPVPALREFVRIAKTGGVVAATVLEDVWVSGGYEGEVEKLREEGLVEVLGKESEDYRRGAGVKARILILKKR